MHYVFYFKFLLANVALAVSLLLISAKSPILEERPRLVIVGYYALRLAVLALILLKFKFGYPTENMSMYYFNAEVVLRGAMPNRDFYTLYGILFPYVLAGAVWLWHDRFALIILLQLVEFAAVYAIFTQKTVPLSLRTFLIFALNPLILVWIWLSLANQSMCLIAVAAAFALRSEMARSLLFALTFASSKIFSLWTIIPALLCQRFRSWVVFGVTLLVIYVPFLMAGSTGISFKATEASGYITDDTGHSGIESIVWMIPIPAGMTETNLTHLILMFTAGLLLAVMLVACWLRFRLGLGTGLGNDVAKYQRDIIFTAIFATLLTMIYQTFATYTIPDYMLGVIIMVPVLVQTKFWTAWDQVLIALTCYFQTIVFLVWFHFAEFGNPLPRTSGLFVFILVVGNICTYALCGRCAYRGYIFYSAALAASSGKGTAGLR